MTAVPLTLPGVAEACRHAASALEDAASALERAHQVMTDPEPQPAMLAVPDAAQAMGVSESTVWRLIRQREIATIEVTLSRRPLRFIEPAEIDAFIKRNRQPARTP